MIKSKEHSEASPRIVGYVCNWGAYSGVEMAGINRKQYPASVRLVKVMCLGRLNPGLILKAFEMGADGVMLLGCPSKDCHYESGAKRAGEVVTQAGKMLHLLGIGTERLALVEVPVGRDDILVRRVTAFVKRLGRSRLSRLGAGAEAAKPMGKG